MWMNEMDVIEATALWNGQWNHPTLGPATRTLFNLMTMTNENSDGWCYWQKPTKAAAKLMDLVQEATNTKRGWGAWSGKPFTDPTAAEVKATYRPIKAFVTRMGGGKYAIEIVEPR